MTSEVGPWTSYADAPEYFADEMTARAVVGELRFQAQMTENELVCCDAYDGKGSAGKHSICYWSGAVVHALRERADEIERTL